jgi:fructose-1,6-bisphosphatase II
MAKGVRVRKHIATTHSVLMRAKSRTMRHITAHHDLRQKTIHLRSDNREHRI